MRSRCRTAGLESSVEPEKSPSTRHPQTAQGFGPVRSADCSSASLAASGQIDGGWLGLGVCRRAVAVRPVAPGAGAGYRPGAAPAGGCGARPVLPPQSAWWLLWCPAQHLAARRTCWTWVRQFLPQAARRPTPVKWWLASPAARPAGARGQAPTWPTEGPPPPGVLEICCRRRPWALPGATRCGRRCWRSALLAAAAAHAGAGAGECGHREFGGALYAGAVDVSITASPHHSCQQRRGPGRDRPAARHPLAHEGVLFLDEFPEFARSGSLEVSARQAGASGASPSRARWRSAPSAPARFQLVAAMNSPPLRLCGLSIAHSAAARSDPDRAPPGQAPRASHALRIGLSTEVPAAARGAELGTPRPASPAALCASVAARPRRARVRAVAPGTTSAAVRPGAGAHGRPG